MDVQYPIGVRRTPYPNRQAPLLNQLMMNRTKLSDLHSRVNGAGGGFTREGLTVHTRIDRVYARENDSTLVVWEELTVDLEAAASLASDHFPVVSLGS